MKVRTFDNDRKYIALSVVLKTKTIQDENTSGQFNRFLMTAVVQRVKLLEIPFCSGI